MSSRRDSLDLAFLSAGTYRALIARDRLDDPATVEVETRPLACDRRSSMDMRARGGFVLRLDK